MKRNIKPQICNLAQVSVLFLHRVPTMQCIPFLSSCPFIHLETIVNHTSFFKVLFYHFIIVLLEIPLSFLVCNKIGHTLWETQFHFVLQICYEGPPVSVDCTWLQRGGAAAGGGGTTTDYPPAPGRHLRHLRPVPRTPGTRTQPHTAPHNRHH